MKLNVFAFRHGETDWNLQRRFQGHTDIHLNDTGIKQAMALAEKLKDFKIPLIVSSDLTRAKQTAQHVVSSYPAKIIFSDQLREAFLGDTEGEPIEKVVERYGSNCLERWLSNKPEDMDFGWNGGETKREQLARLLNFFRKFVREHITSYDHPIGISTHGGVLARLVLHAKKTPENILIPNCAVYKLLYDVKNDEWHFVEQV